MKDTFDTKIGDLFETAEQRAVRKYAAKQREFGRKGRKIWSTEEEFIYLKQCLETYREKHPPTTKENSHV